MSYGGSIFYALHTAYSDHVNCKVTLENAGDRNFSMDSLHSYVSRHQIEMQVFAIKLVFQSDIFVYNLGLTLSLHLKRTIMRYKKLKALFSFFLFCRPIIVAQKASNVLLDIL